MNEFSELVLDLVAQIPQGRVTTYGTISDAAKVLCGSGSPRIVGHILAEHGDQVPWWRVVNSKGECAPHLQQKQYELLSAEEVTFTRSSPPKVALGKSLWRPDF